MRMVTSLSYTCSSGPVCSFLLPLCLSLTWWAWWQESHMPLTVVTNPGVHFSESFSSQSG
uniref:CesA-2 n=1 Tax=Arundo donax TaxID=35708 RepID=A0A0A9ELF2_ARUDO